MTGVFIRGQIGVLSAETQKLREEGHMMTEAECGVMWLQV